MKYIRKTKTGFLAELTKFELIHLNRLAKGNHKRIARQNPIINIDKMCYWQLEKRWKEGSEECFEHVQTILPSNRLEKNEVIRINAFKIALREMKRGNRVRFCPWEYKLRFVPTKILPNLP